MNNATAKTKNSAWDKPNAITYPKIFLNTTKMGQKFQKIVKNFEFLNKISKKKKVKKSEFIELKK